MRRVQPASRTGLLLILIVGWALVGCPPKQQPDPSPNPAGPSTTVPPATVPEIGGQPATQPEPQDVQPSSPVTEPATSGGDTAGAVAPALPAARVAKLVPIPIELPAPAFRGTPKPRDEPNVEKPSGKPRPPFLAPEGTVNLARGKPVIASDPVPASGELDFVTDGDKEASDFGYLELRPGTEWVQIDLGRKATIYAVLCWHNHAEARVYRDVVVQVSDDPDFLHAQTVFNNDYDNSSGLGIGPDMGYVETSEGKLIDAKGVEGRYVRLYSKGNHMDEKNHYTEVEVFGKPGA